MQLTKNTHNPKRSCLRAKLSAYALSALMIISPVAPSIAAQLSDQRIEFEFSRDPVFIQDGTDEYQYRAPSYIESEAPQADSMETFYQRLFDEHKAGLAEPTHIPIGVGDITTIIPLYPEYKYIGTPVVQSRYIRTQVDALLGRTLIDSTIHATEADQLIALYDNAFNYAKSTPGLTFGDRLGRDQDASGLAQDIIWPELRSINGETVLVPVLYLTEHTVGAQAVVNNVTQFNGDLTVDSLTIEGVDIQTGRDTFISVADKLFINDGSISSPDELKIVAGGVLTNLSGVIEAQGDLTIGAHNIHSQTLVYRYDTGYEQGARFGNIADFSADGNVVLRSYDDIVFQGATASAGGTLALAADGSISIGAEQLYEGYESRFGRTKVSRSSLSYLQSELSAKDTLSLIANGEIKIDAATLISDEGHIELLAGMGITVLDELTETRSYKKRKFSNTSEEESTYQTVAMRSLLDAGKGIKIHSEFGDITLRAVDINSTAGTSVNAKGGHVNLLMTTETDHYSYNSTTERLFTTTTVSRGHNIQNGVPNTVVGGFAVEALKGVNVRYEGDSNLSAEEQIAVLSELPGLEWIATLRDQHPNAYYEAVTIAEERWNESSTSLSPAASALLAIVVAVAVGPGMGELIGEAVLGSSSFATALHAGAVSMASHASITSANAIVDGRDPTEAVYDSFGEGDTWRSLAVSMLTAGALAKLDSMLFKYVEANPNSWLAGVDEEGLLGLSLGGQTVQAVTHATTSAALELAINGESIDEFGDTFTQALAQYGVDQLGEHMATKIGEADFDTAWKYISHAGAGCLVGLGEAQIDDGVESGTACSSGAAGAVIGELVAESYEPTLQEELQEWGRNKFGLNGEPPTPNELQTQINVMRLKGADVGKLAAAFSAFITGQDVNISASAGLRAALYNATRSLNESSLPYYTWVDPETGETHFSDRHPGSSGVSSVTVTTSGVDTVSLDEEAEQARQEELAIQQERAAYDRRRLELHFECAGDPQSSACGELNTVWTSNITGEVVPDSFAEGSLGQQSLNIALNTLDEIGGTVNTLAVYGCDYIIHPCSVTAEVIRVVDGEADAWSVIIILSGAKVLSQVRRSDEVVDTKLPKARGNSTLNQSTSTANLTERGTLTNLFPNDPVVLQWVPRTLVRDNSGRYWLQSPNGNRITPSGSYDFVTMPNGTIRVARPNVNSEFSTHLGLSGGGEVKFAGSIRFANNSGLNRGNITKWNNDSGHYQPSADLADNAGLPRELFDDLYGQ